MTRVRRYLLHTLTAMSVTIHRRFRTRRERKMSRIRSYAATNSCRPAHSRVVFRLVVEAEVHAIPGRSKRPGLAPDPVVVHRHPRSRTRSTVSPATRLGVPADIGDSPPRDASMPGSRRAARSPISRSASRWRVAVRSPRSRWTMALRASSSPRGSAWAPQRHPVPLDPRPPVRALRRSRHEGANPRDGQTHTRKSGRLQEATPIHLPPPTSRRPKPMNHRHPTVADDSAKSRL